MIELHSFTMGDVEDPSLYAAQPIWEWQNSEAGKWAMEHANDPSYNCHHDYEYYGYKVVITGQLNEKDYTYYLLKYSK